MNGRGTKAKGANGERELLKLIGDRLDLDSFCQLIQCRLMPPN